MKELVSELKRRNVFRVAVAYFVAAWLVTEAATTVLPILEAPPWTLKLVLLLAAVGFPVVLFIRDDPRFIALLAKVGLSE